MEDGQAQNCPGKGSATMRNKTEKDRRVNESLCVEHVSFLSPAFAGRLSVIAECDFLVPKKRRQRKESCRATFFFPDKRCPALRVSRCGRADDEDEEGGRIVTERCWEHRRGPQPGSGCAVVSKNCWSVVSRCFRGLTDYGLAVRSQDVRSLLPGRHQFNSQTQQSNRYVVMQRRRRSRDRSSL